jgi:hypothetical protein
MTIALVAVAKLEEKYLHEWVRYYLHIGFDMIYLYENNKEPTYAELLKEFPKVQVIHFPTDGTPTRSTQYYVLEDFCKNYKEKHTWMAHFDLDEFIVLKKHKTIHEFCQEYLGNEEGGIVVPWVHFGDNGHETYKAEPVTFRFTKREDISLTKTAFVKSIVCTACIDIFIDWHIPKLIKGVMKTTDGEIITKRETDKKPIDVIQLNHYFCKSKEEFKVKRIRGEVGVPSTHPSKFGKAEHGRYQYSMFTRYNQNIVDDFYAKETYEECLRRKEIQE